MVLLEALQIVIYNVYFIQYHFVKTFLNLVCQCRGKSCVNHTKSEDMLLLSRYNGSESEKSRQELVCVYSTLLSGRLQQPALLFTTDETVSDVNE